MVKNVRRGDVFLADLQGANGAEQKGSRPVLIIQNNIGNKCSPTVIVAVLTSKAESKAKLPTHCMVTMRQGLAKSSLVLLEQIRTLDKGRLQTRVAALDAEAMSRVDKALAVSVGLHIVSRETTG